MMDRVYHLCAQMPKEPVETTEGCVQSKIPDWAPTVEEIRDVLFIHGVNKDVPSKKSRRRLQQKRMWTIELQDILEVKYPAIPRNVSVLDQVKSLRATRNHGRK